GHGRDRAVRPRRGRGLDHRLRFGPPEPPVTSTELGQARVEREGRWRLGVMGGTFDPIHHGHLVAASEVAAKFELDEVVFVPTGVPWQKRHRRVSLAEDRYLMT